MRNLFSKLSLCALGLFVLSACNQERKLPVYGERYAQTIKDENGNDKIDTVYQTIPNWTFLNQDSVAVNQDITEGKIYVTDFFFTSCTTICPTMHRNLKSIFDDYANNPDVIFISHTIDFKYDKPSVLKKYAQKLGVDKPNWQFLYGPKDSIYNIAEKNYLVAVGEDSQAKDGYIHQGYLVLVDKDKKIRGAYDGTKDDQVEQLRKDIPVLLAEYKK